MVKITKQESDFDRRCSKTCSRIFLTIIFLIATAFALLPNLEKKSLYDSYVKYLRLRYALKESLTRLSLDECWQISITKDRGINEWQLKKLLEIKCESPLEIFLKETVAALPEKTTPISPVFNIRLALKELFDPSLLERAEKFSQYFDYSVSSWKSLLQRDGWLIIKETAKEKITVGEVFDITDPGKWYLLLTIPEIEKYSAHDPPDLTKISFFIKESPNVLLPSVPMPVDVVSASIFIEIGLLVSVIYFWLYLREAKLSNSFPLPGTFLGVLGRMAVSRLFFDIFWAVTAIGSALLAYRSFSYSYTNGILSLFILIFSFLISLEGIKRGKIRL